MSLLAGITMVSALVLTGCGKKVAELQQEADEVRKNIAAYINRITQNTAMDDAAAITGCATLSQAVNAYIELLKITRVTS